MLVLMWAVF